MDIANRLLLRWYDIGIQEKKAADIKAYIEASKKEMVRDLAKHLSVLTGDEIEYQGKRHVIFKLCGVRYSEPGKPDAIELLAECHRLKGDGTIDERVKPKHNVLVAGILHFDS